MVFISLNFFQHQDSIGTSSKNYDNYTVFADKIEIFRKYIYLYINNVINYIDILEVKYLIVSAIHYRILLLHISKRSLYKSGSEFKIFILFF